MKAEPFKKVMPKILREKCPKKKIKIKRRTPA
jgi:hypothetical protein